MDGVAISENVSKRNFYAIRAARESVCFRRSEASERPLITNLSMNDVDKATPMKRGVTF